MIKFITISFDFLERMYYFLVRYKIKDSITEYHITIMDGSLEKMLYGNHIIQEKNGFLQIEILENGEQAKLKIKIAEALSEFLHVPLTKVVNLQQENVIM